MRTVIEGCAVATVDAIGTEYRDGHIVIEGDRIVALGEGRARNGMPAHPEDQRIDGRGHLATPGLVNCHHHLYQWATRGLAQQMRRRREFHDLANPGVVDRQPCCRLGLRRSPVGVGGGGRGHEELRQ